jgi:hypothetical protein
MKIAQNKAIGRSQSAGSTAPSIVVFRARAGSGFLPRGTAGAIRSRLCCEPDLRVHTSRSEGLATTARPYRRRSDRQHDLAIKSCPDLLRLRPHIVR